MNAHEQLRAAGLPEYVVTTGLAEIEDCQSCAEGEARVREHVREVIRRYEWAQSVRAMPTATAWGIASPDAPPVSVA